MQTLREARRARAFSIRRLAEEANVSPQTVMAAEQGKPIRLESMRKMSAALGVAPLEIIEFRAAITGETTPHD
jgi:transcriptional regulator with XRE-family HTH domain